MSQVKRFTSNAGLLLRITVGVTVICLLAMPAFGQSDRGSSAGESSPTGATGTGSSLDITNPISILNNAGQALRDQADRGTLGGATPATGNSGSGIPQLPVNGGNGAAQQGGAFSATLSIVLLLTILTVAPALLILCTSFTRIVVVLALLRQAIGTQSLPPSQVIIGLSVFLTLLVMAPTFERINKDAIVPLSNGSINEAQAWEAAKRPLRDFMIAQIEYSGNEEDIYMILEYRGIDTSDPSKLDWNRDVDMLSLIPGFILSELKIAFLMGFRLYLPFLVIDMVISSVLISMGMLMLPPVLISLPFKLLLFVLVDGWRLVAGSLLASFAVPGVTT